MSSCGYYRDEVHVLKCSLFFLLKTFPTVPSGFQALYRGYRGEMFTSAQLTNFAVACLRMVNHLLHMRPCYFECNRLSALDLAKWFQAVCLNPYHFPNQLQLSMTFQNRQSSSQTYSVDGEYRYRTCVCSISFLLLDPNNSTRQNNRSRGHGDRKN